MRIATWNIERLKHKRELSAILKACEDIRADILVLTETDCQVRLEYNSCIHTPMLSEIQPDYYKPTENRITIYSNYKCIRQYQTYDKYTALCSEFETEYGNLLVYGTIMGIYGNRHPNFNEDLPKQIEDIKRLSSSGKEICILGDYNLSFADNYYYTKQGRNGLLNAFAESDISLITQDRLECIDHIAISDSFIDGMSISIEEWNYNKSLSDHKGIVADLKRR